jgi:hypothetical protein
MSNNNAINQNNSVLINVFAILDFIKNQWLGFLVIFIWILSSLIPSQDINIDKIKTDIKIKEKEYIIDTLYKNNTKIINKIKYIKQKEYDTVKIIDTIPTSQLQVYFSNRYKQSDTIR